MVLCPSGTYAPPIMSLLDLQCITIQIITPSIIKD
jgi:hypothetical protein